MLHSIVIPSKKNFMLIMMLMLLWSCMDRPSQNNTGNEDAEAIAIQDEATIQSNTDTSSPTNILDTQVDLTPPSFNQKIEKMEVKGRVEVDTKNRPGVSEKQSIVKEDNDKVAIEKGDSSIEAENNVVEEPQQVPPPKAAIEVDHAPWDQLLRSYVSGTGQVDYAGLKKSEAQLNAYLQSLSDQPLLETASRNTAMAYWINAYNAFTVKLILSNYPVKSIMSLYGGKAWDRKWIELNGKTYSLNQIEHDILRKQYPDPRIHFAVNCAAVSCPPLLNRAFTDARLDTQLDKQTKSFINAEKYNSIAADKLVLSKIFDWYKEDFGDLRSYVNKYVNLEVSPGAEVDYYDYDWALNGK